MHWLLQEMGWSLSVCVCAVAVSFGSCRTEAQVIVGTSWVSSCSSGMYLGWMGACVSILQKQQERTALKKRLREIV